MAFAGGTGTREAPYLVSTPEQLNDVRNYLSSHFKQISDIDLSEYENWESIGKVNNGFYGSYDGGNFKIENFTINATYTDKPNNYIGLFGVVFNSSIRNCFVYGNITILTNLQDLIGGVCANSTNSIIENTHFIGDINVHFNPSTYETIHAGGLIGRSINCITINCHTEVRIIINSIGDYASWRIGGLLGTFDTGEIEHCYSTSNIDASAGRSGYIGGFIGVYDDLQPNDSKINSCIAFTYIKRPTNISYAGGFVGRVNNGSNITNCYTRGLLENGNNIDGFVGGFVASIGTGSSLMNIFENCYTTCQIITDVYENVGAFTAQSFGERMFINCYFNSDIFSIEPNNVIPKTTQEMKQRETFVNWDFDAVWAMNFEINEGYPYLLSPQQPQSQLNIYVKTSPTEIKKATKVFIINETGLKETNKIKVTTESGLK